MCKTTSAAVSCATCGPICLHCNATHEQVKRLREHARQQMPQLCVECVQVPARPADVVCHECGPLCQRCDHVVHAVPNVMTHVRIPRANGMDQPTTIVKPIAVAPPTTGFGTTIASTAGAPQTIAFAGASTVGGSTEPVIVPSLASTQNTVVADAVVGSSRSNVLVEQAALILELQHLEVPEDQIVDWVNLFTFGDLSLDQFRPALEDLRQQHRLVLQFRAYLRDFKNLRVAPTEKDGFVYTHV
jgi:hypothetical protein